MEPREDQTHYRGPRWWALGLLLLATEGFAIGSPGPTPDAIDFFESKVRPIFAERCYACHSEKAKPIKGGLRLDQPEWVRRGGKSGVVVIGGDPESSRLIKAVRQTDPHLQMPYKRKKLSSEELTVLETWVRLGAPMPEHRPAPKIPVAAGRTRPTHWAFQPVQKPLLPEVRNTTWVRTPVDYFVLTLLEKNKLSPAAPVDRRSLIRRVTYDLTGLPPTAEEVDAFVADSKPDAYAQVVERLLASPQYGERWGRYWLDVARYADTKGYLAGGEERRYAFSFTYRDYVIAAFNSDKAYDQFITEQLAADLLPSAKDKSNLAALGFLTLGRRFLNNQNDIIDDRIDVVTRGTLGLTVACARCHDHKFDPIPTSDYYSLHGVFASSREPTELPLLHELQDSPEYKDYLKQREKIEEEITAFKTAQIDKFLHELRQHIGDYLLRAHEAELIDRSKLDTFAGEHKLNPLVLRRWMSRGGSTNIDPVFEPWFQLSCATNISSEAPGLLSKLSIQPGLNPIVLKSLMRSFTNSLREAANSYGNLFKEVDAEWAHLIEDAAKQSKPRPSGLPDPDREAIRQVLYAENAPFNPPRDQVTGIVAQPISDGTAPLRNKIEALNWTHPGAPARAMALVDIPDPHDSHILLRGSPGNPGPKVPRRFLEALSSNDRATFTNGSGRLELARAIVSPANPLTARVYVNRIWLHHFGEGLVKTPGDFGVRTEVPVQKQLLDYLAATFMESGWSTKELQRQIVLSATYQQSCEASPDSLATDPENNLYSHMNRQRLDFEAARDTLLALGGKLDAKLGGLPVDIETQPFSMRRTVYALIERQNLPGVFRTFDFANPDTSSQQRFHTTVPQQALFLMNSPFVVEQARNLARRPEISNSTSSAEQIRAAYRLVFQRQPSQEELNLGLKFLGTPQNQSDKLKPLEQYAQVLLLSNELMFID